MKHLVMQETAQEVALTVVTMEITILYFTKESKYNHSLSFRYPFGVSLL
ncbi:hypothetical protein SAMN05443429_1205 [Cruoricaptor ignavus]|uniref:Uncharacterized protein n=1 Tax=Cruoricaptor ignavus TaxID=1118202 RepID=A0A1M6HUZ8_9FLAO|nr:hypothetical protein SAMN05443429_1205 [Cruoricaptor ignavus]